MIKDIYEIELKIHTDDGVSTCELYSDGVMIHDCETFEDVMMYCSDLIDAGHPLEKLIHKF